MRLISASLFEDLVRVRRHIHAHPELAWQEHQTQDFLFEEAQKLAPLEIHRIKTGLVVRIKGKNSKAPVVAIRGDIDALPIHEATGLPFASVIPGCMHACGHDMHATWALGAAHLLTKNPAEGDVLIIFQPAEEIVQGAKAILESDLLSDVKFIVGGHVDRQFAVGEVLVHEGAISAASDRFDVTITGASSHGARPHEGADPVVAAAAWIQAIQTIVSRQLPPDTVAVISIGKLTAGVAHNIIPESVDIGGTIRSQTPEIRQKIHEKLTHFADQIAIAYGVSAKITITLGAPPIVNKNPQVAWAKEAVQTLLGNIALVTLPRPNMGAEDFAFYMEKIPGCFLRIGVRESGGKFIPAHSPQFYADEGAIEIGAATLAETERVASAALAHRMS
jgi:hippurate hydrolase